MANEINIVAKTTDRATAGFERIKIQVQDLKSSVERANEAIRASMDRAGDAATKLGEKVRMASVGMRAEMDGAKVSTDHFGQGLAGTGVKAQGAGTHLRGVGASARSAGAELEGAEQKARTLATGFDRIGERAVAAGAVIKSVALGIAAAVGAAAVATVGFGIKQAAGNQTAMISFELLLGSAQKAKDFLGKLQAFAAATPFDLPTLKDAASRLLAVGVRVKDVIPLMTQLGNATAGMGTGAEGIQRAVNALQQMKQSGVVHAGDMLQLTDAGIPAWDALAAHFHTTVAKIKDEVSKNRVKPEDLFAAIEGAEGPAFGRLKGMMEKQSASLSGVWSTFKDNMGQALGTAFAPAIPALTDGLNKAAAIIPKAMDRILGAIKGLSSFLRGTGIVDDLKGIFSSMKYSDDFKHISADAKEFAQEVKKNWPEIKVVLEGVGGAIATILKLGLQMLDWALKLDKAFLWLGARLVDWEGVVLDVFGVMVDGAAWAFGWIPGIGPKLKAAAKQFDAFRDSVNAKLNGIKDKTILVTAKMVYAGDWQTYRQGERSTTGHASGGIIGGLDAAMTWTGEHGRELVKLPVGSTVYSHGQSEAMAASAGGGSGGSMQTVMEFSGNVDSAMATAIMKLIRDGLIRIKSQYVTA